MSCKGRFGQSQVMKAWHTIRLVKVVKLLWNLPLSLLCSNSNFGSHLPCTNTSGHTIFKMLTICGFLLQPAWAFGYISCKGRARGLEVATLAAVSDQARFLTIVLQ